MLGHEDCESPYSRLRKKEAAAEKNSVGRLLGFRQSPGSSELGNAYWRPGAEYPTGGLTRVKSETVLRLRSLEPGTSCPGV